MDSWCFDSVDKGYVPNEMVSLSDSAIRSKNVLMGWDFKAPFSYEDSVLVPSQQSVENPGFSELGMAEMMGNHFHEDSVRNVVNCNASVGDIINPSVVTSNAVSGDEDSSSKVSSSVADSNSPSLIDLKLGGFGDKLNSKSPRAAPILSSAESSVPAKRVRTSSLSSQTVCCQVYGCGKDLSSEKDYHKRHKVCDAHSKTATVIVNGIEQRFCQQCSRFHLLAEFDDGKRSCRKRLSGHNERRRKPQVGFNSSRTGSSFHSFSGSIGSKFQGTSLAASSFICQDILAPSHAEKYTTNVWGRHVKIEDGVDCSQKTNTCITEQLQQNSVLPPYLSEKHYFPVVNNLNNTASESVFSENVDHYPHGIVSRSLFQTNSLGNEDLTLFNTASTIQGIPGISESGCALSLLSSHSQNSPNLSPGIPAANPLILPSCDPHYSTSGTSEKIFEVSWEGLPSGVQNRYPFYKASATGRNQLSAMPGNGVNANSEFANGIHQGSRFVNANDGLSSEDGTTINLLQLSSRLQRVESQRQSGLAKPENEGFCCLRMT